MLWLLNFFAGSAARLQALLIGAAVALITILALTVWGLYWRGEYREAKAALVMLEAQSKILAESVRACSAGVAEAKKAGEAAIEDGRKLLAEARRLAAGGRQQAERIERLLAQPTPPGAGCEDAWKDIEKARGAR
ncbi:MAG: hypothetical protein EPO27_10690 [Betaproteobacteria bacterium]|nr:MAG: hypothetical protein EPO27_10690 [Betaproteobacteria bacterium]